MTDTQILFIGACILSAGNPKLNPMEAAQAAEDLLVAVSPVSNLMIMEKKPRGGVLGEINAKMMRAVVAQHGGNVSRAAKSLGLKRTTLATRLRKLA
jgi:transcriptional regulator of acetoin/glycerol metabolism